MTMMTMEHEFYGPRRLGVCCISMSMAFFSV